MTTPKPRPELSDESPPACEGVAIIGMACLFPSAPGLDAYWRNILAGVDAVTDPPGEAWDPSIHYDPSSREPDRVYCKRGGYLGSLATFSPLEHGIPPVGVGGEPDQWVSLRVAREALDDAGYDQLDEAVRRRTAVILGKGTYLNGGNSLAIQHSLILPQTIEILKQARPDLTAEDLEALRRGLRSSLPEMGPELVPGLIPNIGVGRIANRLDLMGPTYTVDAACASSLLAVQLAMRDLRNGECDLALVGGSQVWMPVPSLSVFCQLGALSRRQQIRPFDESADGTLLGEGIGMVVLKRLADAESDGDRIYAVVRGVGVASDGRGTSVTAPRVEGEILALRRAYEAAGVSPSTVELIEAHGTGTPVGDIVEIQALARVFGPRSGRLPRCAIGSVKSMISHTIPAAGVAGLIKVALALYHRVLPPTLHCDRPNPKLGLDATEFYVNTSTRPWVHPGREPRRAGVSAFGFGGINAHAVLEEYRPGLASDHTSTHRPRVGRTRPVPSDHRPPRDSEICLLEADSRAGLLEKIALVSWALEQALAAESPPFTLADVAYTLQLDRQRGCHRPDAARLSVVAGTLTELRAALERAASRLADPGCSKIQERSGLYFTAEPLGRSGKLAFLIPGEGAQYPNMLADLCLHLPEVLDHFDQFDRISRGLGRDCLPSDYVFPRPSIPEPERRWVESQLWEIEGAMGSVRIANLALHHVLERLAIRPDIVVGHSSGEYAALQVCGMLDLRTEAQVSVVARDLIRIQEEVFREGFASATLLAIGASREQAEAIAREAGARVFVAMDNCRHQVVIACDHDDAGHVQELARDQGLVAETLPFDRPYHTPLFASYAEKLRSWADRLPIGSPRVPLYSCTTSEPFPDDPGQVRALLVEHWVRPVEFHRTIETLHDRGVRLFVECGPRGNLSAFVEDILRGRPFVAVPANVQRRSGIAQLNHLVGLLAAQGVDLDASYLFLGRSTRRLDWENLSGQATAPKEPKAAMTLKTGFPAMRIPETLIERYKVGAMERSDSGRPDAAPHPAPAAGPEPLAPRPSPPREAVGGAWTIGGPVVPTGPARRPSFSGARDVPPIVHDFLRTMDQFLTTQREVLGDCLRPGQHPGSAPTPEQMSKAPAMRTQVSTVHPEDVGSDYPLLGRVVRSVPGVELVCRRTFDPAEDRYLLDHALGLAVSDADPSLRGLIIMPLTMTLEILSEAAASLKPGRLVVGLRDVSASRWIAFEDQAPQTLEVVARLVPDQPDRVLVRLWNITEAGTAARKDREPVAEATVLLSESYPNAPAPEARAFRDSPPSRLLPERLYDDAMFHGPLWRGVCSIDRSGAHGAAATLRVLPFDRFFRSGGVPRFVLDPVVLDAAGQVIGFWTMEHLSRGRIVFPFRLEALVLYGPSPSAGTAVAASASIRLVEESRVRSDIEITTGDRTWMRLAGWWDRRFDLPDDLFALVLPSGRADVSEPWPDATAGLATPRALECRRIAARPPADLTFWLQVWSHRVLSRAERAEFRRLKVPVEQRLDWLSARTAAKEAARHWLRRHHGLEPKLADIAIRRDDRGLTIAEGPWSSRLPRAPFVSIAQAEGIGVALVGTGFHPGGDPIFPRIELARLGRTESDPTNGPERLDIPIELDPEDRDEWRLRLRCARQVVTRSLGAAPVEAVHATTIRAFDIATGFVTVELGAHLALKFPALADRSLAVQTSRHGDLIAAATLGLPVDAERPALGAGVPARQLRDEIKTPIDREPAS